MELLRIDKLCKSYEKFKLKEASFTLNSGRIMGFVGRNGAGKTTILKSIMNIVHYESGDVFMFGKNILDNDFKLKEDIGFVMKGIDFFPTRKLSAISKTYSKFFKRWDEEKYKNYLNYFEIDPNKKLSELSAGMKIKYLLSLALSHDAKLFVLDEPTSGLDPISREEILEIFLKLIENKDRAILFSTHITSDLDKVADDITYIRNGEIIFSDIKENLLGKYLSITLDETNLNKLNEDKVIGIKKYSSNVKGLILKENRKYFANDFIKLEDPTIDDILIFLESEVKEDESFAL